MQERVAAETTTEAAPEPAVAGAAGPLAARQILALQRTAGNHAVTRYLARQELTWDPSLIPADSSPAAGGFRPDRFVFILGAKDDEALATAKATPRPWLARRKVIVREDMDDHAGRHAT